jgi:hypothetical protein
MATVGSPVLREKSRYGVPLKGGVLKSFLKLDHFNGFVGRVPE